MMVMEELSPGRRCVGTVGDEYQLAAVLQSTTVTVSLWTGQLPLRTSTQNVVSAVMGGVVMVADVAAVAMGAGFLMQSVADYLVVRTGGSITGFEEGDPVPDVAEPEPPGVPEFDLDSD